jgi:hypothetical protein
MNNAKHRNGTKTNRAKSQKERDLEVANAVLSPNDRDFANAGICLAEGVAKAVGSWRKKQPARKPGGVTPS